ncbi:IPT/TIG domain-containing protein [Pseudaminobacter soli (ex Li et al. 2025)]|uniref:IPT/TIG domain-containing protein n=1 Tax=Pseudaminobacter soli (ex Li et al. 2025) TaxID=1295366 RepID=UPI0015E65A25|nr:IPT/TIG domain-containing protein [Mesorhizobium soli]
MTVSYTDDGGDDANNPISADHVLVQDADFSDAYGYNYDSSKRKVGLHSLAVTSSQLTSTGLSLNIKTGTHIGTVSIRCTGSVSAPSITAQPSSSTISAGANTIFSVTASNATGYQWQVDQGAGFTNITNGAPYSGATASTLTITGATAGMNGYLYRVIVSGSTAPVATSNTAALTVNAAPVPTITAASPNSGSTAGGTTVTLTGTNLTGATAVTFGGTAATGVTVNSATQITATTPAHAAGAVNVVVTTPGGSATLSNGYTYVVPAPIAGAVSATVDANSSGNPITLSLSGGPATSVAVATQATHGTATASGTSITYTPTANYAGADTFTYTATNAGGTSSPATVSITVNAIVPGSPLIGSATAGNAQASVSFTAPASNGGSAITNYTVTSNPDGITATGAASPITVTGLTNGTAYTFTVTATNAVGTGSASAASNAVTPTGTPTLTATSPNTGTTAGGTIVTLTGSNLTGATAVTFGGTAATGFTVNSATQITATTPAHAAGAVNVSVTTLGGSATLTNGYIYAPTITLSPSADGLTGATAGAAYSQTITASGGTAPYAYAITSGSLPSGLTLSAAGVISGTPREAGPFNFTITATDAGSSTGSQAYGLYVSGPTFSVSPTSLPSPTIDVAYSQTILFSGGTAPYAYAFTGTLPTGLSLNATTGELSGTPTAGGTFEFSIVAKDSTTGSGSPYYASGTYTVVVDAVAPTLSSVSPSSGNIAGGTAVVLTGSNLTGATAVTFGGTAATGFTVNSATQITATTPAHSVGAVDVVVITSGGAATRTNGYTYAQSSDATLFNLTISSGTLSPSFASGTDSYTASVANGVSSVSVTPTVSESHATVVVNGSAATSGSPSSIPLNVGDTTITILVTAQDGSTKTYTLEVTRAEAAPIADNFQTMVAANSSGNPITLSLSGGAATSVAVATQANHGTATASGTTISYTPAAGYSGSDSFTYTASNESGTSAPATVTITVTAPTLSFTPYSGALASGVVGTAYSQAVTASGGVGPYTYVVIGSLPANLSLNSSTGVISGTPTATGNASFMLQATDRYGYSVAATYSIDIGAAAPTVISLRPNSGSTAGGTTVTLMGSDLAGATAVSFGGTPATSFTVIGNALITATTPAHAAGKVDVVVTTPGGTVTMVTAYTYTVPALALSPASGALTSGTTGVAYAGVTISASGGTAPYSYAVTSGSLPAGLALGSAGDISGTPTTTESARFTVTVTDANGTAGSASYTLAVATGSPTVEDKTVPAGTTPADVRLDAGATGGPFDGAELVSVEPANAGRAEITWGDYAAAGPVTPVGWYLKFTPNPAYSGQVRVRFRLTNALGSSNTGTVTYTLGFDEAEVKQDIDTRVRGFVQTRQNMIASTIEVPGLMERRRMQTASDPVAARMSSSADGVTLGFGTSLAQMQAARDGADGATTALSLPFNVWVDGTLLAHNRKENGGKWGSFGMVSLGADYLLSEKALVGLSFHYDRMTDPTDADAKLTGNGWLAGPYASFEIGKNVFWDASLLYGGSSNDIGTEFWDGSFDTRRWLFDSAIKGQWQLDDVTVLTPKLRAVYFSERVEDYAVRNGAGDTIELDGFAQEQLRVSLGAEIARSFTLADGSTLTPKLGATAGYSGLDGSGLFGSVSTGLSLQAVNGWSVDGGLLFNIERHGEKSVGAKAGVSSRF